MKSSPVQRCSAAISSIRPGRALAIINSVSGLPTSALPIRNSDSRIPGMVLDT
ncbi:Uncharacterised protein [Mycobacteroides abscessus subsp. abscessus]|nr:Uncharacterised protein [Mycobacteroides abscessus subsp. abscessus]